MKKFETQKTIQLIVFVALSIGSAAIIVLNKGLYHTIATDRGVKIMCAMLWLALGVSFLFIYLDLNIFSRFKHEYGELDFSVHSDPVAGIANRASSDAIIEKYFGNNLPRDIGCVMLELSNLKETNNLYGHLAGNQIIRDFSSILKATSSGLCFVSRNGGNKFLAIFEDCNDQKVDAFINRVHTKVSAYNSEPETCPIKYSYGVAINKQDDVSIITDLISLADQRIRRSFPM